MTTFYCFPSNHNLPAEFVREGISISVIGDHYKEIDGADPVYIGYLVNASEPVDDWTEFQVYPANPMRIFG